MNARLSGTLGRLLATFLGVVTLVTVAFACAWDNDTLESESQKFPEVLDALVGRIRVLPKSYYEYRIKLIQTKNAKRTPEDYDNLTVAYDKLGDYKSALWHSDLKKKLLDSISARNEYWIDQEYRYWANRGTIKAHQSLRQSVASRKGLDKELLSQAIDDLEKAVAINPNAHFGRESVQIEILKMMLNHDSDTPAVKYEEWQVWDKFVETTGREKVVKGIIGMMTFGGGPDSFELVQFLQSALPLNDAYMQTIAELRLKDLIGARKPVLDLEVGVHGTLTNGDDVLTQYALLRKNAIEYRELVDAYVETKLNQGKHPDNDPKFWAEWKEPVRIKLVSGKQTETVGIRGFQIGIAFVVLMVVAPWVVMFLIHRKQKAS